MRSLYWKIFISFWIASILIIMTTAWVISEVTRESSIPSHEKIVMDSYVSAAVATFESGHDTALQHWLLHAQKNYHMTFFLMNSSGKIFSTNQPIPLNIQNLSQQFMQQQLDDGILKLDGLIVSHEIISTSGHAYRLIALTNQPIHHPIQIPWAIIIVRLSIAIFISGIICYWLSVYLTQPLRSLSIAAQSIATGRLNTRVGQFKGHQRDEIAELIREFDRMAEQLELMMHSKERLLQDISHELRSPLTRLQLAIGIGRKQTQYSAETAFQRMEDECLQLNTLIGEILKYSRLDAPTIPLHYSQINLTDLLHRVTNNANFEFGSNGHRVKLIIKDTCTVWIDEALIYGALENILRNALRYSPQQQLVTVYCSINHIKHTINITINDHGPGVPDEQLAQIFNPFYRVDPSRDKFTGGHGLGLSIAQRAIARHHGVIIALNRKPHGLKIRIILPYDKLTEIRKL